MKVHQTLQAQDGIQTDIVKVYILGQYVRGICDYEGVFQIPPHNHKYPTVIAPSLSYYPLRAIFVAVRGCYDSGAFVARSYEWILVARRVTIGVL